MKLIGKSRSTGEFAVMLDAANVIELVKLLYRCTDHPRYTGTKKPQCHACNTMWNELQKARKFMTAFISEKPVLSRVEGEAEPNGSKNQKSKKQLSNPAGD